MTTIAMTTSEYNRTASGKSWASRAITIKTEIINAEQHGRITNDETLRFFRRLGGSETVQRAYTFGGYVVISLSSISPDRTIKKVRQFTFEK